MKTLTMTMITSMALAAALICGGCAPKVAYTDPDRVETVTADFGRTDLQTIANRMIDSLLSTVIIGQGERPVVYFAGVKNKTDEHIDTKNITDKVKVALVKSGKFRVTGAMEVPDELRRQLEYQTGSGMVRPDTAARLQQQIGANYFLYGEMTSIRKQAGRTMDVYYKFTLNMINIETGLLEWAEEKEISKEQRRAWFGM